MANNPRPPTKKQQAQSNQAHQQPELVSMEASFSGPLPLPSILKGYEIACPGAAERIIKMAEEQGSHRRKMEERAADAAVEDMRRDYKEARFGQVFGLAIAMLMIVSGLIVAWTGHPWPGAAFSGGGIGFQLVNIFVRGRKLPEPLPTRGIKKSK